MDERPKIQGVAVAIDGGGVQAAIELAGRRYREKYGRRATHLALPAWVDPGGLKLWDLNLGRPTGADLGRDKPLAGIVIMGRVADERDGPAEAAEARQLELL